MEYTFRNSYKEKPVTVSVRSFSLVVKSTDGDERKIPFARIVAVQLIKNGKIFKTEVEVDNSASIIISNCFYINDIEFEDRGNDYTTFIRVLHHHLKDKSDAVFTSGFNLNFLLLRFLAVCFLAVFAGFVTEFLGFRLLDSFLLVFLLIITSLTAIFIYQRGKFAKQYRPDNIPVQFLP